jgi:hypothetical protein
MHTTSFRVTFAILAASVFFPLAPAYEEEAKPDITLVMPDDTGYGDYMCLGNPIMRTPSVDTFKMESLLFAPWLKKPRDQN